MVFQCGSTIFHVINNVQKFYVFTFSSVAGLVGLFFIIALCMGMW